MKQIKIPLLTLLMLFGLFSCHKEELTQNTEEFSEKSAVIGLSNGMVVLGDKLDNPYSVVNMEKALTSLKSSKATALHVPNGFSVEANTLYVRFLPKDSTDLNILWADTTIELFDYPLDYEIAQEGFYYHDPEIPEERPTWQYTSVPLDYKFPNVKYEILENCYIPEDDPDIRGVYSEDFCNLLELEAFSISHNLDEDSTLKSTNAIKSKKKPSGIIRVDNNSTKKGSTTKVGLEGVMKVKIRVHNFVKWDSEYTGEDGKYKMSKYFRTNVHYAVVYENATGFKIWGNWAMFSPAIYNMGWHPNSGHSREISTSSKAWLWSTVNNGAYYYREKLCPKFGVSKPPAGLRIWTLRMDGQWGGSAPMGRQTYISFDNIATILTICVFNDIAAAVYSAIRLCMPDIFILKDYTNTQSCYATVWHELSHASHFSKAGKLYWHDYVKAIVTNLGYGDGSRDIDGYIGVGEMWGNYFGNYVCCDDYYGYPVKWDPQEDWYNPGFLLGVDNISDVTTSEIFSCLTSDIHSISGIKDKLKTITSYDSQVDNAYNTVDTDWP
jgi:hypothetical protein